MLAATARGAQTHFLVTLRAQRDAGSAAAPAVVRELRTAAAASQQRVTRTLDRLGVRYRPFWVVNAVAVVGGRRTVDALARLPEVASITDDPAVASAEAVENGRAVATPAAATGVEWNIARVNAPSLWDLGVTGQGIVYANADTGVTWDHAALKSHYRGWNGSAATNAYNWWDAIHGDIDGTAANPCGVSSAVPCDDNAGIWHGTHTTGTAVGDDGSGNQIGMAPGAKWIACRNMDSGVGRPSTYIECLQYFLAPTNAQGGSPNASLHADVVGNSYACPPDELCSQGALKTAVDNMRAAGVFMAVAAGNEGPQCSTSDWPPAHYDSSISVGATNNMDAIASFSSRGPIDVDGSGRRKPDLVAPGQAIRSSTRDGYALLNGTSMATPHVGGAVALLWSAFPNLRGDVDATEQLLEETAAKLTTTQGCGGDSATAVPNNVYGYGRIDVYAAYQRAEEATPPGLSVADVSAAESKATVTFTVTLSRPSTRLVTVAYTTADGTATQGADYTAQSGTLTFARGERTKTVAVPVTADAVAEPDETFVLRLSAPTNASLARAEATATITNGPATADTTPPAIAGLKVSGRTLTFTLSEAATATEVLKRGTRVLQNARRSFSAGKRSFRLPALAAGRYAVTVTATDAAGNSARKTLRFTVKKAR